MTILREWRGRGKPANDDAIYEHYSSKVKPLLTASPGFEGVAFGKRDLGMLVEYVLVSYWRDMDCVKIFAGPAVDKAVLPEGTSDVLLDTDMFVRHFEIIDKDTRRAA